VISEHDFRQRIHQKPFVSWALLSAHHSTLRTMLPRHNSWIWGGDLWKREGKKGRERKGGKGRTRREKAKKSTGHKGTKFHTSNYVFPIPALGTSSICSTVVLQCYRVTSHSYGAMQNSTLRNFVVLGPITTKFGMIDYR